MKMFGTQCKAYGQPSIIALVALFSIFVFFEAIADKTTKNDYTGAWGDNSSWVGGTAPDFSNLPSPSDENYTIQGYINVGSPSSTQNLTFSANKDSYTITVNDTLVVYGDVDFANKAMNLSIGNGGLLIIFGDLDMNNKIDINSNGSLIVQGTFNKSGSQGSYSGSGSVYAGSYSGDASGLIPDSSEKDTSTDLQTDLSDVYDFLQENGNSPLPVELLDFTSKVNSNNIILDWSTASELNNDFFTLEKSENGKDFKKLGFVSGNGTTSEITNYQLIDNNPYIGLSYYRLSQTDFDGTTEYFPMISVLFNGKGKNLTVGPNPIVAENLVLKSNGFEPNEKVIVNLINIQGSLIQKISLQADSFGIVNQELMLEKKPQAGVYLLELESNSVKESIKIVVE